MTESTDNELLQAYAESRSESAFEMLVRRYMKLVYSTAFRHVANEEDAREITQAVFILLAQKAGSLRRGTILSGWLYQTTRLTSLTFRRGEVRRKTREQEARMESAYDESCSGDFWKELEPYLDDALAKLSAVDRNVVVMRFFENRAFGEIASALGLKQSAVQKRAERALDKLRRTFVKRGVTISAGAIATALAASNATAAPASIVPSALATLAVQGPASNASVYVLAKTSARELIRAKVQSALVIAACLVAIGGAFGFLATHYGAFATARGNDSSIKVRSAGFFNNAPWVFIASNAASAKLGITGVKTNEAGILVPIVWLMGQAYGISPARMEVPFEWPKDDCSYFQADLSTEQRTELKRLFETTYQLKGEYKSESTEVWVMKEGSSGNRLKLSTESESGINLFTEPGHFSATNVPVSTLQAILENYLTTPVIDETGLTNRFDFELSWEQIRSEKGVPLLVEAVEKQLGIKLVREQRKIKTLVVQQIHNG